MLLFQIFFFPLAYAQDTALESQLNKRSPYTRLKITTLGTASFLFHLSQQVCYVSAQVPRTRADT